MDRFDFEDMLQFPWSSAVPVSRPYAQIPTNDTTLVVPLDSDRSVIDVIRLRMDIGTEAHENRSEHSPEKAVMPPKKSGRDSRHRLESTISHSLPSPRSEPRGNRHEHFAQKAAMHPKKSAGSDSLNRLEPTISHSVPIPRSVPGLVTPSDGVSATNEIEAYAVLVDILRTTENVSDRGLPQRVEPSGQVSAPVPESTASVAGDPLTSLDSATSRAVVDVLRTCARLSDRHVRTDHVLRQTGAIERDSSATTSNVNEGDGDPNGEPRDENATLESRGLRIVAGSLVVAEHCLCGTSTSSNDASIRELIKLAMTRAAALLQVLRFLKNDYAPVRMPVAASAVARRVNSLAAFEQRLRGISIATTTRGDDAHIDADEGLLSNVLLTLLWSTFESLSNVNEPHVTLTVAPDDGGRSGVSFVLIQGHVAPPENWSLSSGDDDARVLRSVGTLAASQIAHLWGGRFTASAGADSATFSLFLPRS